MASHLSSRELHQFNGFVEITFTNVKSLFTDVDPTETQQRLTVRRSITAGQIDYSIDGAHMERIDVKNLLQSYGFTQGYPFQFAIQCDDVTSIEMSNELDRLNWLKNCCGVDEFCSKKEQSKRVLRETEDHIRKIDGSLQKIDVQLNIFGSDETQQIYQRYMLREKELDHFQRQFRTQKIRGEIDQVNEQMKMHSDDIADDKKKLVQCVSNSTEIRREIRLICEQIHAANADEQRLQHDVVEHERIKLELAAYIANLQIVMEKGALAEDLNRFEKQLYEEKMAATRVRINEIDAKIAAIDRKKEKIAEELHEQQCQAKAITVNSQQNQRLSTQFHSVAQRNEHLSGQIKKIKIAISRENRKKSKLIADLQPELQRWEQLKATAATYAQQLTEMNAQEESASFYRQQEMIGDLENEKL